MPAFLLHSKLYIPLPPKAQLQISEQMRLAIYRN